MLVAIMRDYGSCIGLKASPRCVGMARGLGLDKWHEVDQGLAEVALLTRRAHVPRPLAVQ